MSQQTINIGAFADDGTGDKARDAFNKVNSNFTELYLDSVDGISVSTSGSTISLDFASKTERVFFGSTSFGTAKTLAIANYTNAQKFSFSFIITALVGLTFPNSFYYSSGDGQFLANVFTPFSTGKFLMTAINDGSGNFIITITGPHINT